MFRIREDCYRVPIREEEKHDYSVPRKGQAAGLRYFRSAFVNNLPPLCLRISTPPPSFFPRRATIEEILATHWSCHVFASVLYVIDTHVLAALRVDESSRRRGTTLFEIFQLISLFLILLSRLTLINLLLSIIHIYSTSVYIAGLLRCETDSMYLYYARNQCGFNSM